MYTRDDARRDLARHYGIPTVCAPYPDYFQGTCWHWATGGGSVAYANSGGADVDRYDEMQGKFYKLPNSGAVVASMEDMLLAIREAANAENDSADDRVRRILEILGKCPECLPSAPR